MQWGGSPISHYKPSSGWFGKSYSDLPGVLEVSSNAKLNWNIASSSYMENNSLSSRTWLIDNGASFDINGNKNTSLLGWFYTSTRDTNINIADNASLTAKSGGALNVSSGSKNKLSVGNNGNLVLDNPGGSSTITNIFTNGIWLTDTSHMLLKSNVGSIFSNIVQYSTIHLQGNGLAGKFSSNYDGSNASTEDPDPGTIDTTFTPSNWFSSGSYGNLKFKYGTTTQNILFNRPKYIEFGNQPTVLSFSGTLDRLYSLTSSDLPQDSTATTGLISGQDQMGFTIGSNNPNPSTHVTVRLTDNYQQNIVSYFWKDNSDNVSQELTKGNEQTIWSSDGNSTTQDDSGYHYSSNYDNDHGLMMKTTNALKAGTYDGATFDYTLYSGPN